MPSTAKIDPARETVDQLPEQLPVFPLEGALLLPRGQLPLNIFEPRYLAMIEDVLKTPHRLIDIKIILKSSEPWVNFQKEKLF